MYLQILMVPSLYDSRTLKGGESFLNDRRNETRRFKKEVKEV